MYAFLAIVSQQDLNAGNIVPSFVLCQSHGMSAARSGWRIVRQNTGLSRMPKVLVTSLTGNEHMIDFMSSYRTRDHMHGDTAYTHEETKKYYPKGALFWFICDRYGDELGPAVFIKCVPVKKGPTDSGYRRLLEGQAKRPLWSKIFTRESGFMPLGTSGIKAILPQSGGRPPPGKRQKKVQSNQLKE